MSYRTTILSLLLTLSASLSAQHFVVGDCCYEQMAGEQPRVVLSYCTTSGSTMDIPSQVEWKGNQYVVSGIGALAFKHCGQLRHINIPSTCVSIDVSAFMYCAHLESITVDADNPAYCDQDGVLLDKGRCTLLYHPRQHPDSRYDVASSITTIGQYAFYKSTHIKEITFSNTLLSIGDAAFLGCTSLTGIALPSSLQQVGNYAFFDCPHLLSVTVMGTHPFTAQEFSFSHRTHQYGRLILKQANPSESEWARYRSYQIETIIVGENPPSYHNKRGE